LQARDIQTPADVAAWYAKSKLYLKDLDRQGEDSGGLEQVRGQSTAASPPTGVGRSSRSADTFWGNQLNDETVARSPYSNWNELIGLIANTVASSRAITSMSAM
ncbi:MAG: hypothetical protein ACKPKO_50860, partial [Candidatus Fonsibacter sp.]